MGTGSIAQAYALAFEGCALASVVAVADVRPPAAQAFAERLKCRSFSSHGQMADDVALDAVLVCTPPNTHLDLCLDLVGRGLHVLCEKPLSIDVPSTERIVAAARASAVTLTMASKFRYVEDVVRAKSLLSSGALGELILIENVFASRVDMSTRWNSDPRLSGGGVLIDNGTHSVDLIRYFAGPLSEIHVVEGKRSQHLPVEETVHIFVRSESGALGTADLSWSISKELESYLRIYGSKGTISVGWRESKFLPSGSRDWTVLGQGYDKVQAFRAQIENFTRAVWQEERLLITVEDALASAHAVEAAYESLRDSRWTSIPVNGKENARAAQG